MKHTETIRGTDVLKIEGLSKAFPAVQALDDVALTVRRGEIHALIGENGAGKSTLMKILAGIHQRDTGTVCLGGEEINPSTPREAQALGISTVHQELSLAPNLTVAENIFVRREPCRLGLIQWRELERRSRGLLDTFGVNVPASARVGTLSIAMQQVVEIARSLSFEPTVLMLDEPTSSLEDHEVEQLFSVLRDLACNGMSIIYVTHKLKEVFRIADTVTVLRDGKLVATKPACETDMNDVIRMMVGREIGEMYPEKGEAKERELLRVEGLCSDGAFEDISFTLHEGEVLGMAGLVGAGRSEISQTLFGHRRQINPSSPPGPRWIRMRRRIRRNRRSGSRTRCQQERPREDHRDGPRRHNPRVHQERTHPGIPRPAILHHGIPRSENGPRSQPRPHQNAQRLANRRRVPVA